MENTTYYQSKINQALAYINQNLGHKLPISEVAKAANFSPFHFQRIYKALQSETPYETILRLRLEKAVFLLKHQPSKKVSAVAHICGFESAENFSRQFKARYQISPSAFRKDKKLQNSRIYQEKGHEAAYLRIQQAVTASMPDFTVQVETLPTIPIAFIRAIFGEDGSLLVQKYLALIDWATKAGLTTQGELTRFGMSIDNPEVTPAKMYRYDFGIRLAKKVATSELIELGTIPAGQYATLHCIGKLERVAQAWNYLYQDWLPQSGYVPIHYPAIEEFVQGPEEIGWDNFNIKCRIPIKKLAL